MSGVRDRFIREIRYALRRMAQSPGFSTAVVLTLALGIGATTAIFSVVYGVLFRPLPYRDADRLVVIHLERSVEGVQRPVRSFFSLTDLADLQSGTRAFDGVAMYSTEESQLSHNGFAERVNAASVSAEFFATVAGPLRSGRGLASSDRDGSAVVISNRLARRLFGEQNAQGRRVKLGSISYEIVGVADRAFQIPSPATDIWRIAAQPRCCPYAAIGRLRVGQPASRAALDINGLLPLLSAKSPRVYGGTHAALVPIRAELVGDVSRALWVLLASVGLLLVASCANATTLLFGRNAAQSHETAIRVALGASRGRLLTQSLAEGVATVAAAGAAGWVIAAFAVKALLRLDPAGLPRLDPDAVRLDLPAFVFALGVAAATAIFVGLVPAMAPGRSAGSMSIDAQSVRAEPGRRRLLSALGVGQLAASVILIVVAGLLGRSFLRLVATDLGVRPDHVATAAINLSYERRLSDAQQAALADAILSRVARLPGVQSVGAGAALPPHASTIRLTLKRSGDIVDYEAIGVPATPGYFSALGVRLIEGRLFTDADGETGQPVMIMTADTARRFFGAGRPIGRAMTLPVLRNGASGSEQVTLVGVVSNVKYSGLQAAPDDAVYRPLRQQAWPLLFVVARTMDDPAGIASALPREIAAVDGGVAVSSVATLDALIAGEASQPRFRSALLAVLALFALAIASLGLYGIVAYRISQRTKEFGVRMALGADRLNLLALVLREGAALTAAGLAVGLGGALATTGALRGLLYGIEPLDPATFAAASGLLLVVAAVATYVPARRASRLDPTVALRTE
jgi:putative ABC transport system permease protein